jgi:hypothetical protein
MCHNWWRHFWSRGGNNAHTLTKLVKRGESSRGWNAVITVHFFNENLARTSLDRLGVKAEESSTDLVGIGEARFKVSKPLPEFHNCRAQNAD